MLQLLARLLPRPAVVDDVLGAVPLLIDRYLRREHRPSAVLGQPPLLDQPPHLPFLRPIQIVGCLHGIPDPRAKVAKQTRHRRLPRPHAAGQPDELQFAKWAVTSMADEEKFDAVVVGAGPAGTAAAITMAKAGLQVAILERGAKPGSKNVMGGILYNHYL